MNPKKLTYAMALLYFVTIISLGSIIIIEKKEEWIKPKINKKIDNYIQTNFSNIKNITKSPISSNNQSYTVKITSKENKNWYFNITYQNRKIKDTYQTDYIKGKSILSHIEKTLMKETNNQYKILITTTLDKFTNEIKEKIIKENNIKQLPIYTIEIEKKIDFNTKTITEEILKEQEKIKKEGFSPKNYTFIITNKENPIQAVKIENITNNIKKEEMTKIINDIIIKRKENTDKYQITYQYLN